jgi:hypothetical protein
VNTLIYIEISKVVKIIYESRFDKFTLI